MMHPRTAAITLLSCLVLSPAFGANSNETALRDRYLESALKNPRRGPAVERLYQLALQTEGGDALIADIEKKATQGSRAETWTLVGILQEMRGRDADAIKAFEQAIKLDAKAGYPRYCLGSIHLNRSEYDKGIAALTAALGCELSPEDSLDVRKSLGRCYLRARQFDKAKQVWSDLVKLAPSDTVTLKELTVLLVEEEQWEEALDYYGRLRELLKDRPYQAVLCTMAMGHVEARRGKFDEALARYEESLTQVKPDSWLASEIRTRIQELFRKRNDLTGLAAYYEKRLAGPDARDVRTMVLHAQLLVEIDRAKDARSWYEKAVELSPKESEVRLAYIRLLELQKDYAGALKQYEALLVDKPNEPSWLEAVGSLHLKIAQDDAAQAKARQAWEKIAAANPKDPATMVQVAEIFRDHEMMEQADGCFRKAIELAPEVGQYREYYGEFLIRRDKRDQALAEFNQLAQGPRRNLQTLMRLAEVLTYFQFTAEAIAASREAVTLDPRHFEARMQLAGLLGRQEDYDSALAQLDEAAKLAPNEFFASTVVDNRIELLQKAKRLEQVFESLAADLTAKPAEKASPYVEAAKMALALSRMEAAEQMIGHALGRSGDSISALELAARIRARTGENEKLIATLRRLIELAPQNRKDYLRQLASHYAQLGDRDQAIQAAEQIIAAGPDDPDSHAFLATLCERFGMADRSLTSLKEALKVDAKNIDLRLQFARQLERGGDYNASIEQLWAAFQAQEEAAEKLSTVRLLADVCYRADRFGSVIESFQRMQRLTEDQWLPVMCMAEAYRQIEDLTKARELLTSLLAERPDDATLVRQVADLATTEGLKDEAARHLQKLAQLEPSKKNYSQLASLLHELGRKQEARAAWDKMLELSDDKLESLVAVSRELLTHEEPDEALKLLSGAAERDPKNLDLVYLYACALQAADHKDEAAREFARAAELPDPPKPPAKKKGSAQAGPTSPYASYMAMLPPEVLRYQKLRTIRYQMRGQMYSASGVPMKSVPASIQGDPDMLRAAAWYQYCAILRENGKYDQMLEGLKSQNTIASMTKLLETYCQEERWSEQALTIIDQLAKDPRADHGIKLISLMALLEGGTDAKALESRYNTVHDLTQQLLKEQPQLQFIVGQAYLQFLARTKRTDEMKEYARHIASAELTDQMRAVVALGALCDAEDLDGALQLMARIDKQFGSGNQNPFQYRQYLLTRLAWLAAKQNRSEDAARITMDYLRATRPQNSRLFNMSRYAGYNPYGQSDLSFPTPNVYYDQSRLQTLQQFYAAATGSDPRMGYGVAPRPATRPAKALPRVIALPSSSTAPAAASSQPAVPASSPEAAPPSDVLAALEKKLEQEAQSSDEEDRIYAQLALAYFDWWADRKKDALQHLSAASELRPQDISLKMSLAYLRYGMDDKQGTLDALASIPGRYHPAYLPAQKLMLRVCKELKRNEEAKISALRLFNMKLTTQEQIALATDLRELGLTQKAQLIEQRIKNVSTNDLSQIVQLMQQRARSDKKEAGALAKQVLAQLEKTSGGNTEYYRDAALTALKDSGELKNLIQTTQEQLEQNPQSVRVLTDLYYYYTASGDGKKAAGMATRLIALRPNDLRMRLQLASQLMRNDQADLAMEQYRYILDKDPSMIVGDQMWYTMEAFRRAKKVGELLKVLTAMDWSKLQTNTGTPIGYRLAEVLRRDIDSLPEALPYLNKLNDYLIEQKMEDYNLRQVIETRCRVLTVEQPTFIRKWHVIGPFANTDDKGFDAVFPPESQPFASDAQYEGAKGSVQWKTYTLDKDQFEGNKDARDYPVKENIVVYAHAVIDSPVAQTVKAYAGSDDAIKVWANGKLVHSHDTNRGLRPDSDTFELPLKQGANEVLVKIVQRAGEWGFCLRTDSTNSDEARQRLERKWEAFRYVLGFVNELSGFKPVPPEGLPAEAVDRPLGVKTKPGDIITNLSSWMHPFGDPAENVLASLLQLAGDLKQLEPMHKFIAPRAAEKPKDVPLQVWVAILNLRMDRLDEAKAAVPRIVTLIDPSRAEHKDMTPLVYLDAELAKKELWKESAQCCQVIAECAGKTGMQSLLYRRYADRLIKVEQKEKAREVLLALSAIDLRDSNQYPTGYDEYRKQEAMMFAAEGLRVAGFERDAYEIASKLAQMKPSNWGGGNYQDQAKQMLDGIRKKHPEMEAPLVMAALPVSENAIRILWGVRGNAECDKRGNTYAEVLKKSACLAGYTADVLVATTPTGSSYHEIGSAPAEKQELVYENAPTGKLMFFKVAIRDKAGKVAAISALIPGAAGKNLVEDGAFESTPVGALPETRPAGEAGWVLTDLAFKYLPGFTITEGRHPFSNGRRQLRADSTDEKRVYAAPVNLDRGCQYLLGGWVLCEKGDARICRLALDAAGKPIRMFVVNKSHPSKDWVYCVQRLTTDNKLTYDKGSDSRVEDKNANVMPADQKSCRIGFEIEGTACIDDVFLVACKWASQERLLDHLPAPDDLAADPQAAENLARLVAGQPPAATTQPGSENTSTKPAARTPLPGVQVVK